MKTQLEHDDKIGFLRIAASLCNLGFRDEQLDLLVTLYENVTEHGGSMNLSDVAKIEREVKNRYKVKATQELLDKVSVKV